MRDGYGRPQHDGAGPRWRTGIRRLWLLRGTCLWMAVAPLPRDQSRRETWRSTWSPVFAYHVVTTAEENHTYSYASVHLYLSVQK